MCSCPLHKELSMAFTIDLNSIGRKFSCGNISLNKSLKIEKYTNCCWSLRGSKFYPKYRKKNNL